ncbi:DUF6894 family protein [Bosea rubneri]|uniref:DUF6894 domain-containing protein n=1 Tax=Bosea rubneri TaxID=3075434 RepID=A0ABU3SFZ3_9HYPH|nr:hypothetical protein [Bosea sp. ZW T0_25]MDU0343720.1 hypothetical protein [Bosea sp. ZW T0_25]
MPKYRFTTDDGEKFDASKERLTMPNDKAASEEAQRALADMANDRLPDGSHLDMRVSVEDEHGQVVYQASLKFNGESADDMRKKAAKAASQSMNGNHRAPNEN